MRPEAAAPVASLTPALAVTSTPFNPAVPVENSPAAGTASLASIVAYLNDLTLTFVAATLPVIPSLLTLRQTH
ncbi:hypothetical protein [Paraburkholderia sp. SIMBA_053]|uniref:hypothetical protein n=1 Tax=Paraburkholderia sp. SIMBA_053 TaxID=3085794 RepID=UPI00397B6583